MGRLSSSGLVLALHSGPGKWKERGRVAITNYFLSLLWRCTKISSTTRKEKKKKNNKQNRKTEKQKKKSTNPILINI